MLEWKAVPVAGLEMGLQHLTAVTEKLSLKFWEMSSRQLGR